jgi:hypothetical protein
MPLMEGMPLIPLIDGIVEGDAVSDGTDEGEADGDDVGLVPEGDEELQPARARPRRPTAATETATRRRGVKRAKTDIFESFQACAQVRRAANEGRSRRMRQKPDPARHPLGSCDAHLQQ